MALVCSELNQLVYGESDSSKAAVTSSTKGKSSIEGKKMGGKPEKSRDRASTQKLSEPSENTHSNVAYLSREKDKKSNSSSGVSRQKASNGVPSGDGGGEWEDL